MSKEDLSAAEIHIQAEKSRERQAYEEALQQYQTAIIRYQKEGNYEKIAELHQGICLTHKHLFQTTGDEVFIQLAESAALTSLSLTKHYKLHNLIPSCHFRLGEVCMLSNNSMQAVQSFSQALEEIGKIHPDKKAEIGYYRYHLGDAYCESPRSKQQGIDFMKQGLQEITENISTIGENEDATFVAHVWESGACLRLADRLFTIDTDESAHYLERARTIIDNDPRLEIRQRHLQEIEEKMRNSST